ncbi:tRNA-specific adenosine deaminase subunit tad3, partial [Coemansia sp. RSA 552]
MAGERIECGEYWMERVPVEEEEQRLVTEDVYAARTIPKQTSLILQFASKHLPKLHGIEHVKRVNTRGEDDTTLLVVLCQCRHLDRDQLDA